MENEIDPFEETSLEYYLNKSSELHDKFRVKLKITKDYLTQLGAFGKRNKVGDIIPSNPEWPIEPKEAFQLFKKYYATNGLLTEIWLFLGKFSYWNSKAMIDTLSDIDLFIENAKKIHADKIYKTTIYQGEEGNKILYNKLDSEWYNINHIEYDSTYAAVVYGRSFLFKQLLEKKLGVKPKELSELNFENLLKFIKFDRNSETKEKAKQQLIQLSKNENFLKCNRKEFSAIALIFFQTGWVTGISKFSVWLDEFSKIFDRDKPTYKPHNLSSATNNMRIKIPFLDQLPIH